MKKRPLVSVIIPCYNAERFVEVAVRSIMKQSYENLEILCVNDCSADGTLDILNKLALEDKRICIINNETNLKLIRTLNKAISISKGEVIARMDADDISLPDRIQKQLDILLGDPSVAVVSSYFNYISDRGNFHSKSYQLLACLSQYSCRFMCMLYPPVLHPNTLIQSHVLKNYMFLNNSEAHHIEDFELWSRMMNGGVGFKVIPEFLFNYRRNLNSVSHIYSEIQNKNHIVQAKKNIQNTLHLNIDEQIVSVLTSRSDVISLDDLKFAKRTLAKMLDKYREIHGNGTKDEMREVRNFIFQRNIEIMQLALIKNKEIASVVIFHVLRLLLANFHRKFTYKFIGFKFLWLIGNLKEKRNG